MRNSGSRNRMPGNICVDRTVTEKAWRPRKRYRLTANAAKIATATENTDAVLDTTRLFARYRPSGTVVHMSMNACAVGWLGSQVNAPCTSFSGFIAELTIAQSGVRTNSASRVSTTRRAQRSAADSRIGSPAVGHEQIDSRNDEQEHQQGDRHRRALAEVPGDERALVDVDRDDVRLLRGRAAEQHVRRVEVVERPQ